MRYAPKILFSNILLSIVATIVSVSVIEIGLQLIDYPPRPSMGWNWTTSPYKDASFVSDQVNELGYRGQPIAYNDRDYVVLLLGDSFVEAGAQSQEVQPERILQFILSRYGITNARVFSLASAGWSLDQELIALQKFFARYRADAIVHWMTPSNDFWEAGNIDRSVTSVPGPLKPTFVLANNGTLSPYVVSAFRFKTVHLVNLFLGQLFGSNPGNSSIAVREYESRIPSPARTSIPRDSCPDLAEALERSRSHLTLAAAPYSERDKYFLKLTHALQKAIEEEIVSRGSIYVPITVHDRAQDDGMKSLRCVVVTASGNAYRIDWNLLEKASHNDLIKSPLMEFYVDSKWYHYVSDSDKHFNVFGNFDALNQVAKAMIERRNSAPVSMISTDDLIYASGMLPRTGTRLNFALGGGRSTQPLRGFYADRADGRWTDGDGEVVLAVEPQLVDGGGRMTLKIDGYALIHGSQTRSDLDISINGKRVSEISITQEPTKQRPICAVFDLEKHQKFVSIRLQSRQRARPVDLGLNGDTRPLGFFVRSLQVSQTQDDKDCR